MTIVWHVMCQLYIWCGIFNWNYKHDLNKKNVKQNLEREVINDVQLTHDVSNQSHMAPIDWFDVTLIINLLDDIGDGESYLKPKKKI